MYNNMHACMSLSKIFYIFSIWTWITKKLFTIYHIDWVEVFRTTAPHSHIRNWNLYFIYTFNSLSANALFQTESRKMVTLQQALENIHSNNDVEMKKITPIITDFLVSYRGAIYISFVSRFYTCNCKGYIFIYVQLR